MVELAHSVIRAPVLYLRKKLSDKHFFILAAILVGSSSSLAAIVLKYFVHTIERLVNFYGDNYEQFFLFAFFPLIGVLLTTFYIRYFLNTKLNKGSAEISYAIIKKSSILPANDMYAHVLSSGLTVGFGGSVGLESPMVSTGAAIGSNFAQTYGLTYKDRTVLLACGAAAGIAAAFNAPIAGVLFAIEVLLADVSASAFIPLIIAAASGALISKIILKEGIILSFSLQQPFNYYNTIYYIALGIISGFVSLYYTKMFRKIEMIISSRGNIWVRGLTGGLLLFVFILVFPPLYGEGYESIKSLSLSNAELLAKASILKNMISNEYHLLLFLGALIFVKAIAAAITLGSGGNGGNFAPSLFVGAYLGYVFSRAANLLGGNIPESNFTIVAMAGILSGVFYAPLTAIFLIAELTGGYELMIPLMIVSSLSLIVAKLFEPLSAEAKKLSNKLQVTVENRDTLLLSRLELSSLIETNFAIVRPGETLSHLVKLISQSTRNIFPVVDDNHQLLGIIHLDKIRRLIFDPDKYDSMTIEQLMTKPAAIVEVNENLYEVLAKFESTNQWNLPVIDREKYVGFLSKSSILTRYRNELMETT